MKLASNVTAPEVSNVGDQGSFTIKNSAHAFKILSSGLYSDKIKAIVRELSCNAVDSHKEAGKQDVQFDVHLPTQLEPFFSVRDYGIGLDHAGVTQLYTTYFESTKQDSNDYIGALGLGSKSPFSYTDNFTVTAIKDGVQRIYSAYIDDTGCPAIAHMGDSETEEGNGVEVKFSVTDSYDCRNFSNKAASVFKWFKFKPNIIGGSYREEDIEYEEENFSPGVHLRDRGNSPMAIQGNIAYPIRLPSNEGLSDGVLALLACSLVIEFDIGELDIAASREELSYIPLTVNSIVNRLEKVALDSANYVEEQMKDIKNQWERALRVKEFYQQPLFKAGAQKLVEGGSVKLLKMPTKGWNKNLVSSDVLKIDSTYFDKHGIQFSMFTVSTDWQGTVTKTVQPEKELDSNYNSTGKFHHKIPLNTNMLIIQNDTTRGAIARVQRHFKQEGLPKDISNQTIMLIGVEKEAMDDREKLVKKFLRSIHNPPSKKMNVSDLNEVDKLKAVRTSLLTLTNVDTGRSYRRSYEWKWVADGSNKDKLGQNGDKVYYLPLSNTSVVGRDGILSSNFVQQEYGKLLEAGVIGASTPIYGVRKSLIESVESEKNWVSVYDLIDENLKEINTKLLVAYMFQNTIDEDVINGPTVTQAKRLLTKPSKFLKFCKKAEKPLGVSVDYTTNTALLYVMKKYGIGSDIDTQREAIEQEYRELFVKYPMLGYVKSGYHSDGGTQMVLDYIALIDNQTKTEKK